MKRTKVEDLLDDLDTLHPAIRFTTEIEKHRKLAFIDVNALRTWEGQLHFEVYPKPTQTGCYLQ